jgi:prepilin-type N-terminal cleavage/methylation domain-containing protein
MRIFPANRIKDSRHTQGSSGVVAPTRAGFTMMEIAICLAIVGIALVAIIGVLPIGMNVQQDNRQETIIGEDSTVLLEAIRSASLGLDDLTNYIYAITNSWVQYGAGGTILSQGVNGYTYANASIASGYPGYPSTVQCLTNGMNIVGLLSTPEYIGPSTAPSVGDVAGQSIPSLMFGGISNHIVAYAYSISGPAVQKPPQNNPIMQQDSFGYRVYCVNTPIAVDTNLFFYYPLWTGLTPPKGSTNVFWNWTYWAYQPLSPDISGDTKPGVAIPNELPTWQLKPDYNLQMALNMHELRLTYLWPQRPNGVLGPDRQTFRTVVAGQIQYTNLLYFYQPQSFATVP